MSADLQDVLRSVLGPLDGARIAGGCEWCDAYQVAAPVVHGVWSIVIYHDDECPELARRRLRSGAP